MAFLLYGPFLPLSLSVPPTAHQITKYALRDEWSHTAAAAQPAADTIGLRRALYISHNSNMINECVAFSVLSQNTKKKTRILGLWQEQEGSLSIRRRLILSFINEYCFLDIIEWRGHVSVSFIF